MSLFQKATKKNARLRLLLTGPPGSGKSLTAIKTAKEMTSPGKRFCAIDTERGSLSKYSDYAEFDVVELESFDPNYLTNLLGQAAAEGYEVCVVDSLSHFWVGKDGALEKVDAIAKRNKSGNNFTAWRDVTPVHNTMVDAILQSPMHIIATMRVKVDYVMETNDRGKVAPRKVGLAPIQRDGFDYEFDVVADMDDNHNLIIGKTRCQALDGKVFHKPGKEVAEILKRWLTDGAAPPAIPTLGGHPAASVALAPAAAASINPVPASLSSPLSTPIVIPPRYPEPELPRVTEDQLAKLRQAYATLGKSEEDIKGSALKRGADRIEDISTGQADELLFALNQMIDSEKVFGPGSEGPQIVETAAQESAAEEVAAA